MLNIIRGDLKSKPVSSSELANFFEAKQDFYDGYLYIGYPIIGTSDGGFAIDAIMIDKKVGLIAFHLIEGVDGKDSYSDIQDEFYTKIQSKLIQHKNLVNRRKLAFDIQVVTFAPVISSLTESCENTGYPIFNSLDLLEEYLKGLSFPNEFFEPLLSVLQSITTIRKGRKRSATIKGSRGYKLKKLEDSIANLDRTQNAAVIETVEGVQRIRGLAGSGKTIILALKVAYLHAKNPEWKIAVTFNTRSLKEQFQQLIRTFTYEHINEEPNWENIDIYHAWGSSAIEGIYYNFCKDHQIEYFDFSSAKRLTNEYGQEFDAACEHVLSMCTTVTSKYDLIVIDEAQDFSSAFLKICYSLLNAPKRLIYAYDELQSLNKKSMDTPENIFGVDEKGVPLVVLKNELGQPKQDIVLNTCYRNSKQTLTTAHALGFGIYRDQMVQMFAQSSLWNDIGYRVINGSLSFGNTVTLTRDNDTSPDFLSNHSDLDDLISFKVFEDELSQIEYVVNEIKKNIEEDELRPDDIIVVHTNPLATKGAVGAYRSKLYDLGINSNLAGVSTSADVFFTDDAVTFTGIFRAKGNDAAMVYVINSEYCYDGFELAKKRNILFTAITRSKAWVRVCGVGPKMQKLKLEYEHVKNNDFKLQFRYPSSAEMEHMNIVNRDMSPGDISKIKEIETSLDNLKNGKIKKEDLSPELISELRKFLET